MKSHCYLAVLVAVAGLMVFGCEEFSKPKMDAAQKATVEKAIIQATDQYLEVARRRDVTGFMSFFADTAEMTVSENGMIYSSRKAFEEFAVGFFKEMVEMDASYEERHIIPLSTDAALVTGVLRYAAKQRSGETYGGRNVFTFVFIKKGDRWQFIHVHESSVPAESN